MKSIIIIADTKWSVNGVIQNS